MSAASTASTAARWLLLIAAAGLLLAAAVPLLPAGLHTAALEAGRPHLLAVSLGVIGGALFPRPVPRTAIALALAAAVLHAAALRPVPAAPPATAGSPHAWRIAHANLGRAPDFPPLSAWVAAERPDAVSLQEVGPDHPAALGAALPGYAPAWSLPREDSRGGALWLRDGITARELTARGLPSEAEAARSGAWLDPAAPAARPVVECELASPGRPPLRLVLASAARPSSAARFATRDVELDRLASLSEPASDESPLTWLGDFNAPPWSPALRSAAASAGMTVAEGSPRTWPDGPLLGLGVPIDLCLVSEGSHATSKPGPSIGSDHRPILVTITPVSANP